MVTPPTIAADIAAVFGPSVSTVPPNLNDLLLSPHTNGATPTNQAGLTVWPNVQPGVSYGVRSTNGGAIQQFVHIGTRTAPSAYPYEMKPGHTVGPGPNGTAIAYDQKGEEEAIFPAPIAKDARGNVVPSYYEFANDGTTLVKVVDHYRLGVTYPVVADPIQILFVIVAAWIINKCVVNGTKEAQALRGQKRYIVIGNVVWACVSVF